MRCLLATALIVGTMVGLSPRVEAENSKQVLSWGVQEDHDVIADTVTRKITAKATFPDGTELDALAECGQEGALFTFTAFHDGNPAPFAWEKGLLDFRVRMAGHGIKQAQSTKGKLDNRMDFDFYDPVALQKLVQAKVDAGMPKSSDPNSKAGGLAALLYGAFMNPAARQGIQQVEAQAGGTLDQLANADSVLVELPLADGSANAVDLNPQDAGLKQGIAQCVATFAPSHAKAAAAKKQAEDREAAAANEKARAREAADAAAKAAAAKAAAPRQPADIARDNAAAARLAAYQRKQAACGAQWAALDDVDRACLNQEAARRLPRTWYDQCVWDHAPHLDDLCKDTPAYPSHRS